MHIHFVDSVLNQLLNKKRKKFQVFSMDFVSFGCGFFMFGFFTHVFNILALLLVLYLGLFLLQFTVWHGYHDLVPFLLSARIVKSTENRYGFRSQSNTDCVRDPKVSPCETNLNSFDGENVVEKELVVTTNIDLSRNNNVEDFHDDDDVDDSCNKQLLCIEDREFDVVTLRGLVKTVRRNARIELEKERMASASAADEAMAMILRLQGEKSFIEIEFKQLKRLAEQKQEYDEEMIQSLQWIAMKHEAENRALREKLKLYLTKDEMEQFEEVEPSCNLLGMISPDGYESYDDDDEVISPFTVDGYAVGT